MANVLGFAGVAVLVVTLVITAISLALPYWTYNFGSVIDVHWGLWKQCLVRDGDTTCIDLDLQDDDMIRAFRVVRGSMFVSIVCTCFAVAIATVVLFAMKDKKFLFFGAAGCAFVSGVFYLVAFAVYADEFSDLGNLHACFALDVIACILSWIAAGIFIAAKMFSKD